MSHRETLQKLRETLEDALDCTLYPGTKRHDAAINLLAEADALLAKEDNTHPLPDDLYDSKDWRAGAYAQRVEWLHQMYESKKQELDALLAQKEPEPVATPCFAVDRGWTPVSLPAPDLQARVEGLERGIDMLAMLFDKYENGPSCYEEPDERTGYLGNAVRLDDPDFHRIADFLNKHRPVGAAQESGT